MHRANRCTVAVSVLLRVARAAGGAIQSLGMLLLAHHLLSVQLAAAALLRPTPEQLRYQDQELGAL